MSNPKLSLPKERQITDEEFRDALEIIRNQVHHIRFLYETEILLYRSPDALKLMGVGLGNLSIALRDIILNDLVMGVCRITDKADGKNVSITLGLLVEDYGARFVNDPEKYDPLKYREMRGALDELNLLLMPARYIRNKHIGHIDLKAILRGGRVAGITRSNLLSCLEKMELILQALFSLYGLDNIAWTAENRTDFGGLLLDRLAKAAAYESLESERKIEVGYWKKFACTQPPKTGRFKF